MGTTWYGLLGGSSGNVQLECSTVPRCRITVGFAIVGEILGSSFPGGRSNRKMFPDLHTQSFPKGERGMTWSIQRPCTSNQRLAFKVYVVRSPAMGEKFNLKCDLG
jgi:hypothetical protein